MHTADPSAIVQAWQEAVNRQDLNRLLQLSDPNIEVIGPRGSGYGHQLLCDWLGRAGLQLTTLRLFVRGDVVVVAQHGRWYSADSRDPAGERAIASRFRVAGGQVVQFARHEDLDTALDAAGLSYADEAALSSQAQP